MTVAAQLAFALALVAPLQAQQQDTARPAQGVDYRIEARLNEGSDVLSGRARLRYTNRSGTALDTLWFHQHLNAFRPNSAWARRELEYGERRFQDLGPTEHAFERLTSATVDGRMVRPVYPGAPDSTVMALPLPAPLAPGATATVLLDWNARLATLARRQGRRGRHFDWAQWYPRIAAYDRGGWETQPLLPQGEFFGEFGSYDVTMDVAGDQIVGATGVPVEGDPGWSRGTAEPTPEARYRRDFYPPRPADALGLLDPDPAAGRKRIRWRAQDVHHFAWSADPAFRYTGGGELGPIRCITTPCPNPAAIHVLSQPGDSAWDAAAALRRTSDALAFLQELFGPYPWPQLTNLHRIEPGGTEFPMLIMDGSDSEGLIVHESTHQYLHGILANNEFRDGWLDEGFTSFVTNWYSEQRGQTDVWGRAMEGMAALERAGQTQPVATPGAEFRDPRSYSAMTYSKASLVFRMLRELIGEDAFRRGLRLYFEQNRLQHVSEADLRAAMEQSSGRELGWFFQQWLHTTDTLDYGVGDVRTERAPGGWRTRVEVLRLGDAWMPVTLRVGGEAQLLASRDRRQTVEVTTRARPAEVVLDPDDVLLDLDPSNDRKAVS